MTIGKSPLVDEWREHYQSMVKGRQKAKEVDLELEDTFELIHNKESGGQWS